MRGAHRVPEGGGAQGARRRWPRRGRGTAAGARRPVRPRRRVRGADRPRATAGQHPQRRSGGARRRARTADRGHQRGALRHAAARIPRPDAGRDPRSTRARRAGGLAAVRSHGPPALGRGDGAAVRPLSGGGAAGGPARDGMRLRTPPRRTGPAAVRRPRGARRGEFPADVHVRGRRGAVRAARTQPRGLPAAGARAGRDRTARVPRLLPDRVGHRPVLPPPRHPVPGPGVGGELRGLLRAGHHQGRPGAVETAVRTVPRPRPGRLPGHRPGHRVRPAREGHPVRLRQARQAAHRAGGQRDHVPGPFGGAGRGARARPLTGPAGRLEQADRPLGPAAARAQPHRARRPRERARTRGGAGGLPPPPRHPLRGHGDLRPSGERGVPGGVGQDAGPQRAAVGEGRLRVGRVGEVRPARAGNAVRAALHGGPRRRAQGRARRSRRSGPGGRRGLRHVAQGRRHRRVPGGEPRAARDPAPVGAEDVLRPRRRGGVDPSGPNPGRFGASVHPPLHR